MTVEDLIKQLQELPKDATVVAYEGEGIGLSIFAKGFDWNNPDWTTNHWWIDTPLPARSPNES